MKTKTLKVEGHDVEVEVEKIPHDGHSRVIRFTARVGDFVHEHRHTIGEESGGIADYTAETLQAEIDSVRQHVAETAVKHSKVDKLFEEIS